MAIKLSCYKCGDNGEIWTREIVFPWPPYPGMTVGSHVVEEIFVCQGDLDGEGTIEVKLNDLKPNEGPMLKRQGWREQ